MSSYDWCVGKRIRHSEIVVELKNKKPVSVFRTNYSYIHFDSDGFLDRDRFMRDGMVVVQASDVFNCFKQPAEGNLIDANQKFAQRKLHGSIWWKPDSQLERNIFDAAVDDIRCRRI